MRMTRAKGTGVGERSSAERDCPHSLVSKHNVQDVRKAARERGVFLEDVEGMSEEVAYALLFPAGETLGWCALAPISPRRSGRQHASGVQGRVASASSIWRASGVRDANG